MTLLTSTKLNTAIGSAQWSRRESRLGIDVGSTLLKLVRAGRVGKEWTIQSCHVLPLPEWKTESRTNQLPESLKLALKGYSKEIISMGKGAAACSFPLTSDNYRLFDLPSGSESELREMVTQEMELEAGADTTLMSDFWPMTSLSTDGESDTTQVGVVSLSRRLVHEFAQLLFGWGIECQVVDGLPFAIARAAALTTSQDNDKSTLVLDWGYHSTTLVVSRNGQPIYCRVLNQCGYQHLLQNICNELNVDEAAAGHLLSTVGFPRVNREASPLKQKIADWLTEPLQLLGTEIVRTQDFLRLQSPELTAQKILLMGAGGTIPKISQLFSAVFELPCEVWNVKTAWSHPSNDATPLLGPATALATLGAMS